MNVLMYDIDEDGEAQIQRTWWIAKSIVSSEFAPYTGTIVVPVDSGHILIRIKTVSHRAEKNRNLRSD
jgi:hypothetical protein